MATYHVTAVSKHFYQTLRVGVETLGAAYDAFKAYLASPQGSEAPSHEYQEALRLDPTARRGGGDCRVYVPLSLRPDAEPAVSVVLGAPWGVADRAIRSVRRPEIRLRVVIREEWVPVERGA